VFGAEVAKVDCLVGTGVTGISVEGSTPEPFAADFIASARLARSASVISPNADAILEASVPLNRFLLLA